MKYYYYITFIDLYCKLNNYKFMLFVNEIK